MTTEIKVNVKAGLVTTIANSVYSSALMKVRESISNSIDSKATRCLFFFKVCDENGENISKLSLLDNGHGITTDRFVEIFESIGCGLERLDANAYSYFGLGLMSIFKLGKKVSIVSKSEDGEIKKVFIDSYNFFHKDNENKNIEELQEYISFEETDLVERNIISPLSDESFTTWFDGNPSTFTEIIVEELYPDDITELTSASFKDELRKIVPLKPRVDDPFFSHFTEVDQASVVALLDNDTFFPTIDYFHGLQDDETIVRLTKYFPIFNLHGKKFDLYKCEVTTDFAYYVVYSTKDLQPDSDTKESGLWIRNKNFLVKSSDYLMYQGANRIIHEPLSNWIFAEISHKNMKEFLEVTRNQFVIKSDEFKQFRREIDAAISPLNGRLRKIYDYGIQRVKLITGPFEAVGSGEENDPFVRAQKKLFALVPGDNRQQIVQEIIGTLSLIRSDVLEAADTVVFKIEEKEESIVLEDSDNSYIFIDPTNNSSTQITYDAGTNRAIISIPRSMFNSKEITFVGDVYTVHYVDAKQSNDGISFNRDTRQIYVNIFSSDIINYSISFIDVMLAVEYAYRVSQNTLQMREYILLMLGGDYDKTHDIYSNLADNID